MDNSKWHFIEYEIFLKFILESLKNSFKINLCLLSRLTFILLNRGIYPSGHLPIGHLHTQAFTHPS